MQRPAVQERTLERIARWRALCPDLTIRSTFIVGFPGESDDEFQTLLDWLDAAELDRVGCFRYEPVEGAAANARPRGARRGEGGTLARVHAPPAGVSDRRLARKVGSRQQVIIDEVGATVAKGRSRGDAREIDGAVYVASRRPLRVGEIATVRIERADQYDLHGTVVGFDDPAKRQRAPRANDDIELIPASTTRAALPSESLITPCGVRSRGVSTILSSVTVMSFTRMPPP